MLFVRFIIKNFRQNNLSKQYFILLLPRNMEVYGHLLVIPNKHFENIFDIPEEELTHIIKFTKKIKNREEK